MAPATVVPATRSQSEVPRPDREAPEPALFRRYPLLRTLPRVALTTLPTPVQPLPLDGVAEGALFVKRDDRSSALYGGNKPRKLEFALAVARARGSRRIVTTGGIGTHHGLATAIFAGALGMRTTIVVVPQPVTAHVRDQVRALRAFGAELLPARHVAAAAAQVIRAFVTATVAGERPFWLPTGGSSALADVGFVSAALELAEQIAAGELPEPAEIFVPVGSGGTIAGLALGARLAGLQSRLVGVLVTDILPPTPRRLARMANATHALLLRRDPSLPALRMLPSDFEVTRAQLGAGYGSATQAGEAAALLAQHAGLTVETTYTAKCLAEVLERLRGGRLHGPVLYWHTYNSADVWAHAPAVPPASALPAAIRRWLGEDPP